MYETDLRTFSLAIHFAAMAIIQGPVMFLVVATYFVPLRVVRGILLKHCEN